MAVLRDTSGRVNGVHGRHLIGRSRRMHTRVDVPEVSGEHAVIAWSSEGWRVRDLGSRNGTWVRGERVEAGVDVPVRAGDAIAVGAERHTLWLESDEPPGPFAHGADGALMLGEGQMLALPSLDDPVALVHFDSEEGWSLDRDDGEQPVVDGQVVEVAGTAWTLSLPEHIAVTAELQRGAPTLGTLGLDVRVSADEEYVEVVVRLPGGPVPLAPRAYHYPLLVLARARLRDQARGIAEAEQGWIYADELRAMLRTGSNRLNLMTYRARRELEELGVADAHDLVQRRRTTRQVRLGVTDVTVGRL